MSEGGYRGEWFGVVRLCVVGNLKPTGMRPVLEGPLTII